MRITQGMLTDSLKKNLGSSIQSIYELQERIASERRLIRPSDDAGDFARALNLRDAIGVAERYKENSEETTDWLSVTETAVTSVTDMTSDLHTRIVQAANDTLTADERADLAEEVNEMLEAMLAAANSDNAGRFVFAGHETLNPPFVAYRDENGDIEHVVYNGDDGLMRREIGVDDIMVANTTGRELFLENTHGVTARDGVQVFADPTLDLGDAAQGFVPPFTNTIVSINGKEFRLSATQSVNEIARVLSDDAEANVTVTVEETPAGVVPAGHRLVYTHDDAVTPITFDYVSGPDAVPYVAAGGTIYVNGVEVTLVAGDNLTNAPPANIADRINQAMAAAGVTDVTADVLTTGGVNFLRIVGPQGEQVNVVDGTEPLFATLTAESFLTKQSIVDGNNQIVGDQQGPDNVFQTLITLRDDLLAGDEDAFLPETTLVGAGAGMIQDVVNSEGYLSGLLTVTTNAAGEIVVDYTTTPPTAGAYYDPTYLSLPATEEQVEQLAILNRAIVESTTVITDPDIALGDPSLVNATPPPGWTASPIPVAGPDFTINGVGFEYTGTETLRDIAVMISSAAGANANASLTADGTLLIESEDGAPLTIVDNGGATGLMASLGITNAAGTETRPVTLQRDSFSAFGVTLTLGAAAAGTQMVSFGPVIQNTRSENLSEIGLTMRVQGGGLLDAYELPTNNQSGTYRLTVTGLTYGTPIVTGTGALTVAASTMQAAGAFEMQIDAAGNTVAGTVRYIPAVNGGVAPADLQLAQLNALNAGGVPANLSTFGVTIAGPFAAGDVRIDAPVATATVQSEFFPIDGTVPIVTMDVIEAYSVNELETSIPGGKLITGELHVGGQSIVTSTSRVREMDRDLALELGVESSVGARTNRAEANVAAIERDIVNFTELLSRMEDLDVASALVDLQEIENLYESVLAVGARVIQPTLMDFLR